MAYLAKRFHSERFDLYFPAISLVASYCLAVGLAFLLAPGLAPGWADMGRHGWRVALSLLASMLVISTLVAVFGARSAQVGWGNVWRIETLLRLSLLLALYPAFAVFFNYFKGVFPFLVPWEIDGVLAKTECAVHFGVCPWRLLTPVLTLPWVYPIASVLYQVGWLVVLGLGVPAYSVLFAKDRARNARYLYAFFATWAVLGSVAAALAFSVGPVFSGLVLGHPIFPEILAALHSADAATAFPITIGRAVDLLAGVYQPGVAQPPGLAMSAMPSLHVAIATVTALYARGQGRRYSVAASIYAVFIGLVAVASGWHYALDVYAGFAGAAGLWWVAGRVAGVPSVDSPVRPERSVSAAG